MKCFGASSLYIRPCLETAPPGQESRPIKQFPPRWLFLLLLWLERILFLALAATTNLVANSNRPRHSDSQSAVKKPRFDGMDDSATHGLARRQVKEEPVSEIDNPLSLKASYSGITEQDLSCKHIYEELFFTPAMGPFTQVGSARTQWAEQQVKARKTYLQKMTSSKKNLMQITSIPDAGGQINWISDVDTAFSSINKNATSLQSEKREAKKQLASATQISNALINVRKHFLARVTNLDQNLATQEKSNKGSPILRLGDVAPPRMQRLAKDALAKYPC